MKLSFSTCSFKPLACAALVALTAHVETVQADTCAIPLSSLDSHAGLYAAGNWSAPQPLAALDYTATKQSALRAETEGRFADALTAWERVLDRTTCTEIQRGEARTHIKALRPRIKPETDPSKARPWEVLVLVYKELDFEWTDKNGKKTYYKKTLDAQNLATIGREISGFRDLVYTWSSGLCLLQFDIKIISEPKKRLSGGDGMFYLDYKDAEPEFKKHSGGKHYDTVISYIKVVGDSGPNVRRPWTAACYGSVGEFGGAGYMMIPWGTDYPFPNEVVGEMELHEWLHQIDDVVHGNLGYPRGTTRSSDDGRGEGDNRPDGEQEYKKPGNVHTWAYFYKHLMQEHMTRQIWTELTTKPDTSPKPGSVIQILPEEKK